MKKNMPWLALLLAVDLVFVFLLWLVAPEALSIIMTVIALFEIITFVAVCIVLCMRYRKQSDAFRNFVNGPDEENEARLLEACSKSDAEFIHLISDTMCELQDEHGRSQTQLADYQEYVENWAHEIKTPISLLTLVVDNRRDEIPDEMARKLDNVSSKLQGYVDQILYYARLKSAVKDYLMESLDVSECVDRAVEACGPLLLEKNIRIRKKLESGVIFSDKRGIQFILGQIIGNSIKYAGTQPEISFDFWETDRYSVLEISDNGVGVKKCDMPYIFEKGFTGDSGAAREHATGMGLYLVSEMANDLGIKISADSKWQNGFTIRLEFPRVDGREED